MSASYDLKSSNRLNGCIFKPKKKIYIYRSASPCIHNSWKKRQDATKIQSEKFFELIIFRDIFFDINSPHMYLHLGAAEFVITGITRGALTTRTSVNVGPISIHISTFELKQIKSRTKKYWCYRMSYEWENHKFHCIVHIYIHILDNVF